MRELATGRFIAGAENVLLFGPPGVGKTHLAIALGRAAVEAGHSTLFVDRHVAPRHAVQAQQEGKLADQIAFYAKPKLLVVDELGYLPLMGANFDEYLREAHRCLRLDGALHLWEPAGYFEDPAAFCRQLQRLGFEPTVPPSRAPSCASTPPRTPSSPTPPPSCRDEGRPRILDAATAVVMAVVAAAARSVPAQPRLATVGGDRAMTAAG